MLVVSDAITINNDASKKRKLNYDISGNSKRKRLQPFDNDIARWTDAINGGFWLDDEHVNHAQHLLSKKSSVDGLQPVEVIASNKYSFICQPKKEFVQVLNFEGTCIFLVNYEFYCYTSSIYLSDNHWICTSNLNCKPGTVNVFDSLYTGRTNFLQSQQVSRESSS